jgi:hypothetical protein
MSPLFVNEMIFSVQIPLLFQPASLLSAMKEWIKQACCFAKERP